MKKLFSAILVSLLLLVPTAHAAQQTINNNEALLTVRTKLNANFTELYGDVPNQTALQTLSGVSAGQSNLGTFTGGTFLSNQTVKQILQAIEVELEGITDTDNQTVDVFSLSGTNLQLSLEDDGQVTKTVDLSSLQDGTGTDDQTADEVLVTDAAANYVATTVEGILAEIGPQLGGGAVDSVNGETGIVVLSAADVGADTTGTAASTVSTHEGAADPHTGYQLESGMAAAVPANEDDIAALAAVAALTPASIGAATSAQGTSADTAFGWGDHAGLYQAADADLTTYAGITPSANVQTFLGVANYSGMRIVLDQDDLQTLTGVSLGAVNLGTFTGSTIPDNRTIKSALQDLETTVEGLGGGHDAVTIGTANGLSLSIQQLSLAAATSGSAGAMTAAQVTALEAIDTEAELEALIDLPDLQGVLGWTQLATTGTWTPTGTLDISGATVTFGLEDADIPASIARDSEISALSNTKTFTATVGSAFAIGEVGFVSSAGTITRADASAEATAKNMLVVASEVISDGGTGTFILRGDLTVTTHGYTLGAPLFLSETDGGLSTTAPATASTVVRVVAYAFDANTIHFAPSATWIVRQ